MRLLVLLVSILLLLPPALMKTGSAHASIRIDSDEEFATMAQQEGWPGSGTEGDPYVIEGYEITPGTGPGIYVGNTTVYFVVRSCLIHNSTWGDSEYHRSSGILLWNVSHARIEDIEVWDVREEGIGIIRSSNVSVSGARIHDVPNGYGISTLFSENISISDGSGGNVNTGYFFYRSHIISLLESSAKEASRGVEISDSSNVTVSGFVSDSTENEGILAEYSNDLRISFSTMSDPGERGIELDHVSDVEVLNNTVSGAYFGISSLGSENGTVEGNVVMNCDTGIVLDWGTRNFTVRLNLLYGNEEWGVGIYSGASSNIVFENSFYYNGGSGDTYDPEHVQAFDSGEGNLWNLTVGNYWHDWANNNETNDRNGDGIVDYPYQIYYGKWDFLPLKEPPVTPPQVPELGF